MEAHRLGQELGLDSEVHRLELVLGLDLVATEVELVARKLERVDHRTVVVQLDCMKMSSMAGTMIACVPTVH